MFTNITKISHKEYSWCRSKNVWKFKKLDYPLSFLWVGVKKLPSDFQLTRNVPPITSLTWEDCALNSLCCCCCRCETEWWCGWFWWLLREGLECCRCWGGRGGGGILVCPCGTWYGWNWLWTRLLDEAAPMPLVLPSPLSLLVSIAYRNTSHNNNATTSMQYTVGVGL